MTAATPRISRATARKTIRLLHMKYKPAEIAGEMGVTVDTVYRSYLPAGAPHEKDPKGNVWIVGDVFAKWALECAVTNGRKSPKVKLAPGQVYCLKCNQVVEIQNPRKGPVNKRGVMNLSGRCPICNTKVNRFVRASEWRESRDQ